MKNIIRHTQNSPEWIEWRRNTFGASDCAAMLGISPYKSRTQLMREKMGEPVEVSDFQAEIFAQGHEAEQAIMPHLQYLLHQSISSCIMEMEGGISASLDGISFEGDVIIEHKLYRNSKSSQKRFIMAQKGELEEHDMAQVQQQLMVSGADECWFVLSDGTRKNMAIAKVKPDKQWFARIVSGWDKFRHDLESSENDIFNTLAESYINIDEQIKTLMEEQKQVRERLISYAQGLNVDTIANDKLTLKKIVSQGAVDYKTIPVLAGVNLDQYRKPASISWRINIGA